MGHAYRPDSRRVPVGVTVQMVRPDGESLMIERIGAHGAETWSFPGGWMLPNETPEEAAAREAWEEVGVLLNERLEFRGYTVESHPEGLHGLTLWFVARVWGGKPRNTNPDRIRTVEWWSADRLGSCQRDKLFLPLRNALDSEIVLL